MSKGVKHISKQVVNKIYEMDYENITELDLLNKDLFNPR